MRAIVVSLVTLLAVPPIARAQSLAEADTDSTAPIVRLGNIATQLDQLPRETQSPAAAGRAWQITPSIGVQELVTDNVLQTTTDRRADLITAINPGILISRDGPRLTAVLDYAPSARLYTFTAHQNYVDQEFNGQALATLVPDLFFLQLNGNAGLSSTSGGLSQNGSPTLNSNDRTQTYNFSVGPYLRHRFGSTGTGSAGYTYSYTNQSGNTAVSPFLGSTQPYFVGNALSTSEEYVDFTTGEFLGRLQSETRADLTQNSGFGVLGGAYQNFYTEDLRYALTRLIALTAEGGYEQIHYAGFPPTDINDPIWSVGTILTPNPQSTIIVTYGHRYGYNAANVNANYQITPRIQLFGAYSDQITTNAQQQQNALNGTTLTAGGTPINTVTGAPTLTNSSFFGQQNSLLRVKQGTFGANYVLSRDTFSIYVQHQDQSVLANSAGTVGYAQSGTTGNVGWAHALSPTLSSYAYAQYGVLRSPVFSGTNGNGNGNSSIFTLSLSLSDQLSPSLTASLQYLLTNQSTAQTATGLATQTGTLQNVGILGLTKTF